MFVEKGGGEGQEVLKKKLTLVYQRDKRCEPCFPLTAALAAAKTPSDTMRNYCAALLLMLSVAFASLQGEILVNPNIGTCVYEIRS